jgi:hypothetical protein
VPEPDALLLVPVDPLLHRVNEVGTTGPAVAVRDSKHPDGPQLAFAPDTWKTFIEQLKATS